MNKRKGYKKLTTMQTIQVYERLQEELVRVEEGGCYYKNPEVDDQVLANEMGFTINQIQHVRMGTFGKLVPPRPVVEAVDRKARAAIQQLMDIIAQWDGIDGETLKAIEDIDLPLG